MTAVGPPSGTVEIEWTAGTWTDVTSYVALEQGLTGTFGRPTEFDDVSAGTWALTLRNDDGRFTPNNPLSPYYPNVVENCRLRVTITPPSGSSYVRFLGFITGIEPSFPDEDGNTGVVRIDAADLLAVMNRRTMHTGYVEQANFLARLTSTWNDVWNFDDSTATVYENLGEAGTRTSKSTATVKAANSAVGTFSAGSTDELIVDGALTFNPAGIVGQILEVDLSGTAGQIDVFVKIPTTGLAYNATASARTTYSVVDFWSSSAELWSLRVENSGTTVDFSVRDSTGTFVYFTHVTGLVGDQNVDTDTWTKLTFIPSGADTLFAVNDGSILSSLTGTTLTGLTKIFFGGNVPGGKAGKQTNCLDMTLSGLNIENSGHGVYYYFATGTPPTADDGARSRYMELAGYGSAVLGAKLLTDVSVTSSSAVITSATANFSSADVGKGVYASASIQLTGSYFADTAVISSVANPTTATLSTTSSATASNVYAIVGPAILGTDNRSVVRYNTSGQTLAEAMQLNARTVGAAMWINNVGVPTMIFPDSMRSTTAIATVDIEADCRPDGLELRRGIDQAPTRVTVTSPVGQQVVIDTVAEALGYRRDLSVSSGSPSNTDLEALGSYYLAATKQLRVTKLTVDLAQSANNLYASFFGSLQPGARVRISNLPSATFGFTYVDIFVQGWTEYYDAESATLTFDCSPADAPAEAAFDDAEYGRFAADGTLDLAFPITSGGTTVTIVPGSNTASTTPVMSTSAGDYTLDVDLTGERVTLAGVPSVSSRTNRCTNPSFETNTTTWTGVGSGFTTSTIATSTTRSYAGSQSLKVTWPTAGANGSVVSYSATGLTIGQTYTFSVYVYVPSGSSQVKIQELTSTGTSRTSTVANTGTTVDNWVRLDLTLTAAATSHGFALVNTAATTSGQVCYVDSALLELTSSVGSFFDGTYGGSWTGTANASTSTQATQVFSGVTRGVVPTIARAHLGGEDVDIWHAAALSL